MSKFVSALCGQDSFSVVTIRRVSDSASRVRGVQARIGDAMENYNAEKVGSVIKRAISLGFAPEGSKSFNEVLRDAVAFLKDRGEEVEDLRSEFAKNGNVHPPLKSVHDSRRRVVLDSLRRRRVRDAKEGMDLTAAGAEELIKKYSVFTDIEHLDDFIYGSWDVTARDGDNAGGIDLWVRCAGKEADALVMEYGVTFIDANDKPYGEYKEYVKHGEENFEALLRRLERADSVDDVEERLRRDADNGYGVFRSEKGEKEAEKEVVRDSRRVVRDSRTRYRIVRDSAGRRVVRCRVVRK